MASSPRSGTLFFAEALQVLQSFHPPVPSQWFLLGFRMLFNPLQDIHASFSGPVARNDQTRFGPTLLVVRNGLQFHFPSCETRSLMSRMPPLFSISLPRPDLNLTRAVLT